MSKLTYTINQHWYQYNDSKHRQNILLSNLATKNLAEALIKSARLQTQTQLRLAKKKGDKDLYDHLFQVTYSITTNITSL